jgi:hypothetical protein
MTALYQKMMPFANYSNFILFCEVKILGYRKGETSTSYCLSLYDTVLRESKSKIGDLLVSIVVFTLYLNDN